MNVVARLRNLARKSFFLAQLRAISLGQHPDNFFVRKGVTRICIEGSPRSGNSFATRMFRKANDVRVAHHTHSTGNVARALRYGIPVVILIRKPVDAIVSAVIAGRNDIDGEVLRYLTFYRWIEPRVHSVVLVDFELVISDFNRVIRCVNEKYNTAFACNDDLDAVTKEVKRDSLERHRRIGGDSVLRNLGIPNPERERLKEEIRPLVSRHARIDDAQALYSRLSAYTVAP